MPAGLLRARGLRRMVILGLALVAFGTNVAPIASEALLIGRASTRGNAFVAASVSLTASPATALLAVSGLQPGGAKTGSLTLTNAGTVASRYAMRTSATNADGKGLGTQLQLIVHAQGTSCAIFDGVELYAGNLASAAIGDPGTGNQAGDRTLAAGDSETLCFKLSLPVSTPVAFESASTSATFTFSSEQTSNNP